MAIVLCPECKESVSSQATSCPKCGYPINRPAAGAAAAISAPKKSRSLAIFLALILGGLGAHKFYVDKPGAGFLYLLFCWTLIPSLFGLIEAIQYLSMKDEIFQEKYLAKKL
jgi:TM2 domain-containing membrane protein YozV